MCYPVQSQCVRHREILAHRDDILVSCWCREQGYKFTCLHLLSVDDAYPVDESVISGRQLGRGTQGSDRDTRINCLRIPDDAASYDEEREYREDHGHTPTCDPRRDGAHYLLYGFAMIVYVSVVWHDASSCQFPSSSWFLTSS